ncbi:MAG: hypothetical protein JJ894_05470 [Dinoroseobacter sp.]|nr:hypothetical protein [Dinoroseobacter sp.]
MLGTCKLCGAENAKMARSHIIPKRLYGKTLAPNPKGSVDTVIARFDGLEKPKRSPKGEYDTTLLCSDCEARFQYLDGVGAKVLYQSHWSGVHFDSTTKRPKLLESDSGRSNDFRLFLVFLLWRMSATQRQMFSNVKAQKLESLWARALLEQDVSVARNLDCILVKFERSDNPLMGPARQRHDGVNGYKVLFAGYSIWLKTDERPLPTVFKKASAFKGQKIRALHMKFDDSPEKRALLKFIDADTGVDGLKFGEWAEINSKLDK